VGHDDVRIQREGHAPEGRDSIGVRVGRDQGPAGAQRPGRGTQLDTVRSLGQVLHRGARIPALPAAAPPGAGPGERSRVQQQGVALEVPHPQPGAGHQVLALGAVQRLEAGQAQPVRRGEIPPDAHVLLRAVSDGQDARPADPGVDAFRGAEALDVPQGLAHRQVGRPGPVHPYFAHQVVQVSAHHGHGEPAVPAAGP
jgi:hypothetical protein